MKIHRYLLLIALLALFVVIVSSAKNENDDEDEDSRVPMLLKLKIPFPEEKYRNWFNIPKDAKLPIIPDRVKNLSKEDFVNKYALKGIPFIVTDMIDDWGAKDWSFETLSKRFPEEKVKAWMDYESAMKGRYVKFKDSFYAKTGKLEASDELRKNLKIGKDDVVQPPQVNSWWWYPVSRGRDNYDTSPVVQEVKKDIKVPYFLDDNEANRFKVFGRIEAFFGLPDSGVSPHSDEICEWIFTSQTEGKKRWMMGMLPNAKELEAVNPGYKFQETDTNHLIPRILKEQMLFDVVLTPGDSMFFPPGMIHSTRVEDGVKSSTSISVQIGVPLPDKYLVEYMTHFLDHEHGPATCFVHEYNKWMFGATLPESKGSDVENKVYVLALFGRVDANDDGKLDVDELTAWYGRVDLNEQPSVDAEKFLVFNDHNKDGFVTRNEFAQSMKKWTRRAFLSTVNALDRIGEEEGSVSYQNLHIPRSMRARLTKQLKRFGLNGDKKTKTKDEL